MRLSVTLLVSLALVEPDLTSAFSFTSPTRWGLSTKISKGVGVGRSTIVLADGAKEKDGFSLTNLFGKGSGKTKSADSAPSLRGKKKLEPHPSVRPHVSPLNRLGHDKANLPTSADPLPVHPLVRSGVLDNGLPYIILPNKSPADRFEAHLQVFSGSGKCFAFSVEPNSSISDIPFSFMKLMNWSHSKELPI